MAKDGIAPEPLQQKIYEERQTKTFGERCVFNDLVSSKESRFGFHFPSSASLLGTSIESDRLCITT